MKKAIRYIGSKEKLLPFLEETIFQPYKYKKINFFDGFSGTTVVSKYCQDNYNWNLHLSDFSKYSKVLSSRLFISNCSDKIINMLSELQHLDGIKGDFYNEFSITGNPKTITDQSITERMFFTEEVGMKIDAIRHYIKKLFLSHEINEYEKDLLLHILICFADKNANTTSVYGAFLKKQNRKTLYVSQDYFNILKEEKNKTPKPPVKFYNSDIIESVKNIPNMDVVYLDPPYSTRKYESNYHILNYLSDLDFSIEEIKVNSKTALPKSIQQNSFGSKKETRHIFKNMILGTMEKTPNLFISYSTDGEMKVEEFQSICDDNNFTLEIFDKEYKKYSSSTLSLEGKTLKEIILKIKYK